MPQYTIIPIATQEVVLRLHSEGWTNCPDLGFPALCQGSSAGLREFILSHLEQSHGWLWKTDLEMAALVFSILDHEFQTHPHLQTALQQLQDDGWIEMRWRERNTSLSRTQAIAITLTRSQPRLTTEAPLGQRIHLG